MANNKDKLIAGAQKLVEKGQFEKAIKEYLKVVQQDDKDVRIWLKIGDLYAKLNHKAEAAETYQRVAQFYSDQGFYLKSVAVYKQILKIEPRLVEVNQRLAELYKQLGLLSDAMMQYETVAAFFHREGKTREALAALKQIVELDPETVANRIKLAELYSKEQMPREAIEEFSKAAEQLRDAGRTDDFMKVAERLLFHSPDNRPISKELARLYIDKGDPRRALPKLQVCFKADSRDTEVLSLLAKAFEALDQRSKSVSVLKELARILGENGDNAARVDVYRKIIDLEPGDAEADAVLSGVRRGSAVAPLPVVAVPPPSPPSGPPPSPWRRHGDDAARRQTDDMPPSAAYEFDDPRPPSAPSLPSSMMDEVAAPPPPSASVSKTSVGQLLDAGESGPRTGGRDDEEVERILNETDVYIKYKLFTKAIEHVQRVFESDSRHVEAREKLKALYLTVGKRDEAVLELWALAEQAEPGRQRRYLREILELDPTNARAAGLLGVEATEGDEMAVRADEGSGQAIDVDQIEELGDDEFAVADPSKITLPPDDIEDGGDSEDDLIPVVVEPMRAAGADAEGEDGIEDRFGLVDEPVEDRFGVSDEPESPFAAEPEPIAAKEPSAPRAIPPKPAAPKAPVPTIDPRAGGKVPASGFSREPSEHDLHTRFDDQALKFLEQETLFGGEEIDESELPPVAHLSEAGTATTRAPALRDDGDARPATFDEGAPPPMFADIEDEPPGPTLRELPLPENASVAAAPAAPPERSGDSNLEDDLDEADFFVQQSLFDEARSILEGLLARLPSHPLVTAKLRDLEAMEHAAAGGEEPSTESSLAPVPSLPPPAEVVDEETPFLAATTADLSAELPADLPGATDARMVAPEGEPAEPFEMTRKGVIEKGVTAEDFETHYDLGIAYKEMGLLDDAISEFKQVMKDPPREVQCHLMIGLCCLEKGLQTEAIGHFKKGLYVEGITERESLSLYFELGQAYERLQDPREALYYYEKVVKRDPRFRNVEKHIELLRSGAEGGSSPHAAAPAGDEVDAAFDGLLGDDSIN